LGGGGGGGGVEAKDTYALKEVCNKSGHAKKGTVALGGGTKDQVLRTRIQGVFEADE